MFCNHSRAVSLFLAFWEQHFRLEGVSIFVINREREIEICSVLKSQSDSFIISILRAAVRDGGSKDSLVLMWASRVRVAKIDGQWYLVQLTKGKRKEERNILCFEITVGQFHQWPYFESNRSGWRVFKTFSIVVSRPYEGCMVNCDIPAIINHG